MYLDKRQERILDGEEGWAKAKALEIIVKVGEALGAEKLVEIRHAHVSGISYLNIGEPGLKLLEELAVKGGKASVYTTVNPSCIDLVGGTRIIDQSIYREQLLVNKALEKMGFNPTYTCIPYLHRPPMPREHLAWGESNAVAMANSFYGAMTNREGGPLALAAALTGYTYYAGLHILENRLVHYHVVVEDPLSEEEYSMLGLWIGENIDDVPLLEFKTRKPSFSEIKLLLASSAASGSHGLVVLKDVTPYGTYMVDKAEKISVDGGDFGRYHGEDPSPEESVLGYIGCPHLHPYELRILSEHVSRYRRVRRNAGFLVSVPYAYRIYYRGIIEYLRSKGVDVVYGTCPIVSKLRRSFDVVATNSGKALFYLSRLHGLKTILRPLERIVEMVMEK